MGIFKRTEKKPDLDLFFPKAGDTITTEDGVSGVLQHPARDVEGRPDMVEFTVHFENNECHSISMSITDWARLIRDGEI
jgi:hypothetical protein